MNHKIHFEPAGSTFPRHRRVSLGLLSIFVSGLLIWTALVTPSAIADDWSSQAKQGIPALVFTNPFGEVGAGHYGPRVQVVGGTTIENTSFDVKNPDLGTQIKCFGVAFNQLWHAGVDYYDRTIPPVQGGTIAYVTIRAVANGTVRFAQDVNYPGWVVIIEHNTGDGRGVFSVYAHLNTGSVPSSVTPGASIARGATVGTVLQQNYSGAYPAYHTTDDSHLHFEIRTFYDGTNIYPSYPTCNKFAPGVGYTYPTHPTSFPNTVSYYIEPMSFIQSHQIKVFVPTNYRFYNPNAPGVPQGYP